MVANKEVNCREVIVITVKKIIKAKGVNEFTFQEVLSNMKQEGTAYKESTIRTHIIS